MLSKIKNLKIFLILTIVVTVLSGNNAAALGFATFNEGSSQAQNSCIFDVKPMFLLNTNYDIDSAEVDIKVPEASFEKTLLLTTDGTYAYTDTTVSASLPEKIKSFNFTANFYMSPKDSNVRKLISTTSSDVVCTNPAFKAIEDAKKEAQNQQSKSLFTPIAQNGGSTVQYGNRTFNISGIGSALSGCMGAGDALSDTLGSLFESTTDQTSVKTDDTKANKRESCGDALAYAASRVVIANMAKSVSNWATTGNNGNPYYPTNYKSLFENIKSKEIQSFINELQTNDTKNPYNLSFAKSLANKTREQAKPFAEKYAYSGPSASFFNDFKKGGWESWYKYMLIPQNNSLGYSEIASKKAEDLKNQAVNLVQEELQNNNGFLSQKVCDDKSFKEIISDTEKSKLLAAAAKGDKVAIMALSNSVCKNYKISTPGSIIAKQLQDVLGSPLRQAESATQVDQALGTIFDNMVSQMINKGITSLANINFKNNVDFSYNIPNQGKDSTLATGGSFWDQYNTNFDLHNDLPGIIKNQKAFVDQLNKNNQVLGLVLKSIDKMDYALPGPHIGWEGGIPDRIYKTAAGIKREMQLNSGGIVGNLQTLGLRDVFLDGSERVFISVFSGVFDFYKNEVINKFDPGVNANMPKNSSEMISMILTKESYQSIYTKNVEEINSTNNITLQLEDINTKVVALYKKACERFKKENPGSTCVY